MLPAIAWWFARGAAYVVTGFAMAAVGGGFFVCWEEHLMAVSLRAFLGWGFFFFAPALMLLDYGLRSELVTLPRAHHSTLQQPPTATAATYNSYLSPCRVPLRTMASFAFLLGMTLPIPVPAKMVVAPAPRLFRGNVFPIVVYCLKLFLIVGGYFM